ncbi:MAG: glycosyltransferase [bacterium]|nr:glycosyltransferase [bacterium]
MAISRIAMVSVHTSPLAPLGGKKTGGMNVYIRELAQELGRRGIGVDIYTRRTAPGQPDVDTSLGENVRVIHVFAGPAQPLDPNEVYPYLQQFAAGIIAFTTRHPARYDLVYSHYWLSGWVANKLKEVWNTPFIQMFHTLGHMKNRIDGSSKPSMRSMLPDTRITLENQIVAWADRIIAATPAEHAQLLWLYRADARKITIVPPGVDADRFRPIPREEAKARLNLSPEDQLLLFVGRIEPLKAVDTILEAINLIRQQQPEALEHTQVAIIGGDPDNPADKELSRLRALTEQLNLADLVDFLGAKDHQWLAYYYAAATTVIMPSDYESFGMVALEAMASGTPVIASGVGGLAFLVEDERTGFLVPVREPAALAERIIALLTHPQQREEMGQNAAELARTYAWSNIADRLLPIFEDVAARRSASNAFSHHRH